MVKKENIPSIVLLIFGIDAVLLHKGGKLKINRSDNDTNSNDNIKCTGTNDIRNSKTGAERIASACFSISISAQLSVPLGF